MQRDCKPQSTPSALCSDSPHNTSKAVSLATSFVTLATTLTTAVSGSFSPTISERSTGSPSSISTSSLLSDDPYKTRVDELKVLIRRLEEDLLTERLRNKGASTLSTCLQEEKAENNKLRQRVQQLQTALQQSGQTSTDMMMNGAQAMDIPSSLEQEQLARDNEALRQEVRRLKVQQGTPTEKDREITRLNQCNAELTQSMTEQTSVLKTKLNQTAAMCQQLAGQLDQTQTGHKFAEVAREFTQLQVNGHDVTQENEQLKDQVNTLNTQLQEVVDMNTRWQSYNKQREEYLQTLKEKIKDMEDTAANDKPLQLSEQQQLEIDRIILQYKQKVEVAEEEKVKLGDENRELRLQTDRLTAENLEKDNMVQTLKDQVVQVQTAGGSTRQDAERIQVLEHQVRLCTEDFESERHDRERAQAKIEELEQELKIVRRQLDQFQGRQMDELAERRRNAMQYYRDEYERSHPGYQNAHFVGRGGLIESDGPEDNMVEEDGEGYDTVDCAGFEAGESTLHRVQQEDTLECPKCKKEFPISKHEELLEHTEECI